MFFSLTGIPLKKSNLRIGHSNLNIRYKNKNNQVKNIISEIRWKKIETHSFTAAVRGFHYYRRFWRPKENEKLYCLHGPGNAFDRFAIKTVNEKGEIVGHLPKDCKLSSRHYRRSPLVQGGLEIQCEVVLISRATMLQSRLTACYMELVTDLYIEPAEDRAVGNLFNFVMTLPPVVNTPPVSAQNRKKKKAATSTEGNKDIREMFSMAKRKKETKVIVMD